MINEDSFHAHSPLIMILIKLLILYYNDRQCEFVFCLIIIINY